MAHTSAEIPMSARPISVRLRSDVDRLVAELAHREGNSRGAVVRRLVAAALQANGQDTRPDPELTTAAAGSRG